MRAPAGLAAIIFTGGAAVGAGDVYSAAWTASGDVARAYPQKLTGIDDARLANQMLQYNSFKDVYCSR